MKNLISTLLITVLLFAINSNAQDMEVTGQMKVKDIPTDNSAQELLVKKDDGTLAKLSLASLISNNHTAVDSLNSFWRDLAVIQTVCGCENLENLNPDLLKRLLSHGYTKSELTPAGSSALFNNVKTVSDLDSVSDGDGNWYHPIVVTNGTTTSVYLKEPLITTKYIDGTPIPFAESNAAWSTAGTNATGAYCWPNGSITNINYGALYNQYAISEKEMCPYGYETAFPTQIGADTDDFALGAKEIGTSYWNELNVSSNSSKFSLRGAGSRNPDGTFFGFRDLAYIAFPSKSYTDITYPSNDDRYFGFQGQTLQSISYGSAQLDERYFIQTSSSNNPLYKRPASLGFTVRCRKIR